MKKNPYNKTNQSVSRLGFGAWPLGNTAHGHTMTEKEGIALVKKALEKGINFFDTAPNYASGRSETILGKALEGKRSEVVINTKFGHHPDGTIDFGEDALVPSIEGSMKRLKTDYLDSVILHNPDPAILKGETRHFEILKDLRAKGKILTYGVSIDTREELENVLERTDIGVIELLFNINAQQTRDLLLELENRDIALIIKVPLDSGWLTGAYTKDKVFTDIKSRWTETDKRRRHELINELKTITGSERLTPYALAFIWSFPAVTTVIPGIRTEKQLEEHVESEKVTLSESMKEKLIDYHDENIKGDPLPW